jgi:hypothetical protein
VLRKAKYLNTLGRKIGYLYSTRLEVSVVVLGESFVFWGDVGWGYRQTSSVATASTYSTYLSANKMLGLILCFVPLVSILPLHVEHTKQVRPGSPQYSLHHAR